MLFILVIMVGVFLAAAVQQARGTSAPLAPLPAPANIACLGWARTTVRIYWADNASDESGYRLFRSIDNGAWTQIQERTPNADGGYPPFDDTGADVSAQNRRYKLRSYRTGDGAVSPDSAICNNRRIYDPGNFRIFYGLRGLDLCPLIDGFEVCVANVDDGSGNNRYARLVSDALTGSVQAFTRNGYTRRADTAGSGLDKIPIHVVWCDGGGCAGGESMGFSPMMLETPFNLATRAGDPVAYMVSLHELYHYQQFKYGGISEPDDKWIYEGQARSVQDKFCLGTPRTSALCFDDISTGDAGYVPEVNGYLGAPSQPLLHSSYGAALFWTYLTEQFGTSVPTDAVEGGSDFLRRFWENAAGTPGRSGIQVIDSVLAGLGRSERFVDAWKNFVIANYAKNLSGSGVDARYRYVDMSQTGGSYNPVALKLDHSLGVAESLADTGQTVSPWSANYYRVRPDAVLPTIAISFTQETSAPLYYVVLCIRGGEIACEQRFVQRNLHYSVSNSGYEAVVVIVAGLDRTAGYRYSFNGFQPFVHIVNPTNLYPANVGDPAAPEKLLLNVELLSGDATPLPGARLNEFSFFIGGLPVPASSVILSATVMGHQMFLIRPPTQATADRYDLNVRYTGAVEATESRAVGYSTSRDSDTMIVLDRSGSMGDYGKLGAAKAAASLFVDSLRSGDRLGVLSFATMPSSPIDMPLADWTIDPAGGSRQTANTAIAALDALGGTNIGDSLFQAWQEIKDHGSAAHSWALVLLSDGDERDSTPSHPFGEMLYRYDHPSERMPIAHSVAVGPDADRFRMQYLANSSHGSYQYISLVSAAGAHGPAAISNLNLDMDLRYRMAAAEIKARQPFISLSGPAEDGIPESDQRTFEVEKMASELSLSLSWDPATGALQDITLTDPFSKVHPPVLSSARHRVWLIPNPESGTWTLDLVTNIPGRESRSPQTEFLPQYLVQGAVRSDVTLDALLSTPLAERTPGAEMDILAGLTDIGPIASAAVEAYVVDPGGIEHHLWLYDDGAHQDGAASDGLYGGRFFQTGQAGDYNVTVVANGASAYASNFHREKLLSFHLESSGDKDQDKIPDDYEQRHPCMDAARNDYNDDPDGDGLNNGTEWVNGSDPCSPDSDNGGESDRTDRDPLDPADDRVYPIRFRLFPLDGKTIIRFTQGEKPQAYTFYRSSSPLGPWELLQQVTAQQARSRAAGGFEYVDQGVKNGEPYCYLVEQVSSEGAASAALDPQCATPQVDTWAPSGRVRINDGTGTADSPLVSLALQASDSVSPASTPPGDEDLVPLTSATSGVTEMLISNFSDMHDAQWQPFQAEVNWKLGVNAGQAGVYVRFRDAAGNASETIPAAVVIEGKSGLRSILLPLIQKQ
jgi:Mg-chelatase subunit ChlD